MKKAFLGALASLMLAGAISAASGLTTTNPSPGMVVIIGDGTFPMPLSATPVDDARDAASHEE